MLKKVCSFFICCFAAILLVLFSSLIAIRMFFSPTSMSKLAEVMIEDEVVWDEEFNKYIDKDKLIDELGQLMSDYFKYMGGVSGATKPSTEGIIKVLDEMIEEYENEYGISLGTDSEIQEIYDDLEADLNELVNEPVDEEVKLVFSIIYSQALLIVLVVGFIGCIFVNYLLRKDWFTIMRHTGIISTFNALAFFGCCVFFNNLLNGDDSSETILIKCLMDNFLIIGVVSLVIGVLLIILSIVLRKNDNNMIDSNNNTNSYNNLNNSNNPNNQNNQNFTYNINNM